jgi:3-oxoadipate enol-lactonase / 4-carboxymuconolactone decarboxylase
MTRLAFTTADGQPVHYDLDGPDSAPLLVVLPSLGTTTAMWEPQMAAFTAWFSVLRIEHPGHGDPDPASGPYTIDLLGGRVMELLDSLGVERFSFVGLSLGGMVGMWLASHTRRVERLVVCCAAPNLAPPEPWLERAADVRARGTAPLAEASLRRWFTASLLEERPEVGEHFSAMLSSIAAEGYASCCEALSSADLRADLGRIEAPTLIVSGALDPVVAPASAAQTMSAVAGASLCVLSGAAHLASYEQPDAFNAAVLDHLTGGSRQRGLAVRRAVLGDAHVDRQLAEATELTATFQDFLTRWPWGEVWARPGLDRDTRRMVTIAMLVALGRSEELAMHVRAALRSGMSRDELRELLLHSAIYAGVPAANAAFAVAARVIAEETGDTPVHEG